MAFWLLKTEPDVFGWDAQIARGAAGEPWTGVRNHQAKNNLAAMAVGDEAFFYHTGGEKAVVGVVTVAGGPRPDPTDPAWICVDVVAKAALPRPVPLGRIKVDPALADMALVRHTRLSVQPVTPAEWARVMALASQGD
jgi:predicted RNA-binding protein with PUA-like domain